jgi:hypothetical protein
MKRISRGQLEINRLCDMDFAVTRHIGAAKDGKEK